MAASPSDGLAPSRLGDKALFPPGAVMRLHGTPHHAPAPGMIAIEGAHGLGAYFQLTSWRASAPTVRESLFRCKHTRSLPNHVDAWIGHVCIYSTYIAGLAHLFLFGIISFSSSSRFDFSFYTSYLHSLLRVFQPLVRSNFSDIYSCYLKILWKI